MSKAKICTVSAFQFSGSADLKSNTAAILRGLDQASTAGADLLVSQECALCGYAPLDRDSTANLDSEQIALQESVIANAVQDTGVALALGTSTKCKSGWFNSLLWIDPVTGCGLRYHKRAQYGEDARYYQIPPTPEHLGITRLHDLPIGLRICFEFRFPEYFRELFCNDVQLAVMGFSMCGNGGKKLPVARAHLLSRAAENGMALVISNNINQGQDAPSCIIDQDGACLVEAPLNEEALISATLDLTSSSPLRDAICTHARALQSHA